MAARGCGGSKLKNKTLFCAAKANDVTLAIEHVKNVLPKDTNLYGVGISLGAHLLVRYIGEQKEKCLLKTAVAISPPYNLYNDNIERNSSFLGRTVYNRVMNNLLKRLFNKNVLLYI